MTRNDATKSAIHSNLDSNSGNLRRPKGLSGTKPARSQTSTSSSASSAATVNARLPDRAQPLSRSRGRLSSARDRQRLRERQYAERVRVEDMLATAPVPLPIPAGTPTLRALRPQPSTCPVCASEKVVCDEVVSGGLLKLSECLHCEHRWTKRPRGDVRQFARPRSVPTAARTASFGPASLH